MFFKQLILFVLNLTFSTCYQTGYLYVYNYETSVKLVTPKSLEHSIPSIISNILVEPIKDNLLKITLNDFKSENVFDVNAIESSILVDFKSQLIYYDSSRETSGSLLFKRGLIDLLSLNQSQSTFLGDCSIKSEFLNATTFRNLKFNCSRLHLSKNEFRRNEKILNSLIERTIESIYNLSDESSIQHVTISDTSKIFSEFNSKSAHTIESKQKLNLVNTIKSSQQDEILLNSFTKQNLSSNFGIDDLALKLVNLKSNVKKNEKNLEQILKLFNKKTKSGSSETAKIFLEIVKFLRNNQVKSSDAQKYLNGFLNKEKLEKILIEAYLASQTDPALQAVINSLDLKNEKKFKLLQALLVSSSLLGKLSSNDLIQTVENLTKKPKFRSQAYLTLGSLVNLASQNEIEFNKSLDFLLNENNKDVKDYNLKLLYLESLKNTKLANEYLTNIDNFKSSAKLLLSSLKYMDSLHDNEIFSNNDLLKNLTILFQDSKVKEELRLEILNLILDKYESAITFTDSPLLENILIKLFKNSDKTTKEFKYYCQQLILNKIKSNPKFEKKAYQLFSKKSVGLSLLDFISLNGSSIVVSAFANEESNSGIGFNLKQLMTDDGFMRSVDLGVSYIDKEKNFIDFLKFEIYGNNLNVLSKSGKTGDPSVSIHLSVMGKKLNIVQLFKGYTDMISLVWKLPTKMTSLFDVNFLLSDQSEYLILQNGLVVKLETLGAISFDMSAKTDISIWSQSADLKFKKSTAVRIEQKLTLFNDLNILNESEFNFDTQILVDLSTFIDFSSSPSKVCVQVSNRKFYLKESSKLTSFKLNKIDSVKHANKRIPVQPVSLMLSKQAVANC